MMNSPVGIAAAMNALFDSAGPRDARPFATVTCVMMSISEALINSTNAIADKILFVGLLIPLLHHVNHAMYKCFEKEIIHLVKTMMLMMFARMPHEQIMMLITVRGTA